ncbi:MAG: NERD domain-containing protein [Verrucomicrobiaceae bacterium]|nr:NERD domain-containing protein [Verrucomicrobiaceae bacterium]
MARLVPHHDTSTIEHPSERSVAEALCAQLPPEVVVFHSYPWLRPERHERSGKVNLHEGEADFVILHPRFGIMVVEVKGGHVYYDQQTMRWERHGARHEMKDPFVQAAKNMHALEATAKERYFKNELPFVRGYCAVFPDCEWTGTAPPGAVNANLFAASDLSKLGTRLEALFRAFDRRKDHAPLPTPVLDGLMKTLTSEFKLTPALWREIEQQERVLFRFTEDQLLLLNFLNQHRRAAVRGVAGSGKTQLALAKARQFADEGKRVLLLCYNRMLADWLAEQVAEQKDRITAINYHRMALEWCGRAKVAFPAGGQDEAFWSTSAARLFENAIERLDSDRFDAVVVDEGQDFHESWWDSVEWLNRDLSDGPLYVFYDPAQQLQHQTPQRLPQLGTPYHLPTNCRNTKQISDFCAKAIGHAITVKPGQPEGRPPTIRIAANEQAQKAQVAACLDEWLSGTSGLSCKQIAILSAQSLSRSSLRHCASIGRWRVTGDLEEWRAGKAVLHTTLRRFKGMEADAVIVHDIPKVEPTPDENQFSAKHLYVACSRAKHLLCLLSYEELVIH